MVLKTGTKYFQINNKPTTESHWTTAAQYDNNQVDQCKTWSQIQNLATMPTGGIINDKCSVGKESDLHHALRSHAMHCLFFPGK